MIWALNAGSEATCIHTIDGLIKADQPSCVTTIGLYPISNQPADG